MGARITRVWLSAPKEGWREQFPFSQAERMLSLRNPAWVLDDEKFIFENGKIRRDTSR